MTLFRAVRGHVIWLRLLVPINDSFFHEWGFYYEGEALRKLLGDETFRILLTENLEAADLSPMMDWLFAKRIVFFKAGPAMYAAHVTQVVWKLNFMTEKPVNKKFFWKDFYLPPGLAKFSAPYKACLEHLYLAVGNDRSLVI